MMIIVSDSHDDSDSDIENVSDKFPVPLKRGKLASRLSSLDLLNISLMLNWLGASHQILSGKFRAKALKIWQ